MPFFTPFPFPNFGNGFFYSLPVPEFWEWTFSIHFPFPNFGNGIFYSRSHSRTLKSHSRSPLGCLQKPFQLNVRGGKNCGGKDDLKVGWKRNRGYSVGAHEFRQQSEIESKDKRSRTTEKESQETQISLGWFTSWAGIRRCNTFDRNLEHESFPQVFSRPCTTCPKME